MATFGIEVEASASLAGGSIGVTPGTNPTAASALWVVATCGADQAATFSDTQTNSFAAGGGPWSIREAAIANRDTHGVAEGIAGGADTITATYGGASVGDRGIYVLEVKGVKSSSVVDGHSEVTDTGTNPTATATSTNAAQPGVLLSAGTDVQGGLYTLGAGMTLQNTEIWTGAANKRTKIQYKTITSTGGQTSTFGNAALDRGMQVAVLLLDVALPVITAQPSDVTVYEGQTANFSVTATGTGTVTYQWKQNGSSIGGETASSYARANVTYADNGNTYTVDVTDTVGTTTSRQALLTVLMAAKPFYLKA